MIRLEVSRAATVFSALLQGDPLLRVAGEELGVREWNEIHYDTPNLQLRRNRISLLIVRRDEQWIQRCCRQEEGSSDLQWVETVLTEAQLDIKPLRKLSLFPLLTVEDMRALEPVFTLHCRERSWRLSFPENEGFILAEERGYWKIGAERYPFHDLVMHTPTGALARWYQTALELAWSLFHVEQKEGEEQSPFERYGPTLLADRPALRAFGGMTGQLLLPVASAAAPLLFVPRLGINGSDQFYPLSGELSARQIFVQLAGKVLQAICEQHQAVLYGNRAAKLEGIAWLHLHVRRLHALLRFFDPLLPRSVSSEWENEFGWLLKELLLVQECQVLQQISVEPLLEQFVGHGGLEALLNKTRNGLLLAIKRLEKGLRSFRFTRLVLGMHNWLHGGLWDFLSDPLVRDELDLPLQRRAGEWLQESYQRVRRQGLQWSELTFAERSALVTELDQLGDAVVLFAELFANKRGRISGDGRLIFLEALQRMQEALHLLLHIESSQRFLLRGVGGEESALQAMQRWQAERLQKAMLEAGRCWDLFANKLSFWS